MSGTISLSQKSCKHFGIPTDECTSSIPVVNSFLNTLTFKVKNSFKETALLVIKLSLLVDQSSTS